MISASRKIVESTKEELIYNTEQEQEWLESLFLHDTTDIEEQIDGYLANKPDGYIREINALLDENKEIVNVRERLQTIGKIIKSEKYETSIFFKLNKLDDIYLMYKQISLLLKRIEFGFVEDAAAYIEEICELYDVTTDDVLVILEVE